MLRLSLVVSDSEPLLVLGITLLYFRFEFIFPSLFQSRPATTVNHGSTLLFDRFSCVFLFFCAWFVGFVWFCSFCFLLFVVVHTCWTLYIVFLLLLNFSGNLLFFRFIGSVHFCLEHKLCTCFTGFFRSSF